MMEDLVVDEGFGCCHDCLVNLCCMDIIKILDLVVIMVDAGMLVFVVVL